MGKGGWDQSVSGRDIDAATFTHSPSPSQALSVPRASIPRQGYPEKPETIGEHIRKRRMDLGLFQREVAGMIGVKAESIYGWERGVEPELRYMPHIISFLGYVPFECPQDTIGQLAYYKRVNGLSYEGLGREVGIHHEQLQAWLTGRTRPSRKSLQRIKGSLGDSGHEEVLQFQDCGAGDS